MGSHVCEILGVKIFWQVGRLGIKKFRTHCGTAVRVKYVFYIQLNKYVHRMTWLKGFIIGRNRK